MTNQVKKSRIAKFSVALLVLILLSASIFIVGFINIDSKVNANSNKIEQSIDKTPPIPKWEYTIEAIADLKFDTQMAELGEKGWELVFARRAKGSRGMMYECIFKRPLVGEKIVDVKPVEPEPQKNENPDEGF